MYKLFHVILRLIHCSWSQLSTDDPLKQLQTTFFFAVVEKAYNAGGCVITVLWAIIIYRLSFLLLVCAPDIDVLALLPQYNDLLGSPNLVSAGLSSNANFQYLIRVGYEQVDRVRDSNMSD